ncbi:helix-turn-helix domain-containing protein [Yersinia bercovieri]|uniref:helix-turn-helix domain-containing protein n=1 Tax=Yersinia bercovieri TaxID=634 RepID=UPI0011AB1234|nr:helix-turn-helix transcriptional regulator [Yersinia bercovieri]
MKITMAMSDVAVAKEVYERLETYRQARGISQETLVENLGISRPTYARIQKGTCSLGTFISVLRALNLLEGLNTLVPAPALRPSDIVSARAKKVSRVYERGYIASVGLPRNKGAVSAVDSRKTGRVSIKEMLANRKK